MDVEKYITEQVINLAYPEADDISAQQIRNAFRTALPGILAQHEADLRTRLMLQAAGIARHHGCTCNAAETLFNEAVQP